MDTNIVSGLVRDPRGPVAGHLARIAPAAVAVSIVVAAELRFGAARIPNSALAQRIGLILDHLTVVPLEPPAEHHYAAIRSALERAGTPIRPNDLLIAAHALALGATVVTANLREFGRVPGLVVDNWLQERGR
ncbi:MAG: PIN domain-containing protein [Xanthomonadales bacterium]|nr:PIN domain-containing protein [Xanthomonadales bacterium]